MSGRRRVTGINPISKQSSRLGYMRNTVSKNRPERYEKHDRSGRTPTGRSDSAVLSNEGYSQTFNKPFSKNIAEQVHNVLQNGHQKGMTLMDKRKACIELLDQCEPSMPVVLHIDEYGYDIVQYVVGKGDTLLLKYIVERGFNIAIDKRKCSSLLHIACGNKVASDMISLLLDYGANVCHKASTCFPHVKHYILAPRTPDVVCNYHHVGCCKQERGELLTPLHAAIVADRLPVVKCLLNQSNTNWEELSNLKIVEFACHKGAVNCMPYLIEKFPTEITTLDTLQRNLIWFSFRSSEECGMTFLREAIKHGFDKSFVNATSQYINNGTMLHHIYRLENCYRFMDILDLFLEGGFEIPNLRITDSEGMNLLHLLMLQMGKRIPSVIITNALLEIPNPSPDYYEEVVNKLEKEKEKQFFALLEFLIKHKVDKDALANNGEGIMHKLLHNCVYLNLAGFSTFCKILPQIIKTLEYLLRHGLDLSISAQYVSTPMNYLVHTISSFHAEQLDEIWPNIWYLFTIFLKYGSDPNATDKRGVNNISILLTTLHRWLNYCISNPSENPPMAREQDLPIRTLIRVQDVLYLFFRHGLKPRQEILELCCKQIAILCNIKYPDESFIDEIRNLFKPFFLNGVNPNTLRMITEGNEEYGVPCQLHAQFYLARSFIIHYHTGAMHGFFVIFRNTLERQNLNSLLLAMCTILLENFDSNNGDDDEQTSGECIQDIMAFKQVVRPLKCLSRISIANALSWRIEEKKSLLPLPKLLQEYLCQL